MHENVWVGVIRQAFQKVPPVARVDLAGKVVVVVGASSGIGLEAAKHFATMNPQRLILACRSQSRGEAAAAKIAQDTGYEKAEVWIVDLEDLASVNAFAEKFDKDGSRLDLLVENAGIIPSPEKTVTKDGWDPAFQTNNLATSLLALLLVPKLLETAEKYKTLPRLVVVSSGTHYATTLDDRVIDAPNPYQVFGVEGSYNAQSVLEGSKRYWDTKLLNVFFARALASNIGNKVVVNSVDPGLCYSGLRSSFKGFLTIINAIMDALFAYTSEEGARQLVWAAVAREPGKEETDLNGAYVARMGVQEPSDFVVKNRGPQVEQKLWDTLIEELEKINPKVRDIVNQHLIPGGG